MPLDASTRLLALTLSLEEALKKEAWAEAQELFSERDRLISTFEQAHAEVYTPTVQQAEKRILDLLRDRSADIVDQLRQNLLGRKAIQAYHRTG